VNAEYRLAEELGHAKDLDPGLGALLL
jgi:hypothetical protein